MDREYDISRNNQDRGSRIYRRLKKRFNSAEALYRVLKEAGNEYQEEAYSLDLLMEKFEGFYKEGMEEEEKEKLFVQAAAELTTQEAPMWEMIAARLSLFCFQKRLNRVLSRKGIGSFYEKIVCLTGEGLYGAYILEHYSREGLFV